MSSNTLAKTTLTLALLLMACAALTAGLLRAAPASAPAPDVIDVSVNPPAVNPGEPITVETNVHNPSGQADQFTVVVLVDDVPEEERTILLPPGATQTLRFTVVRSEPGVHLVRVGAQATTFHVLSATFQVHDLIVQPPVVGPGQPVLLTATVDNVGGATGLFQVPLSINGTVVDVRDGLLEPGQGAAIAFVTQRSSSGSYAVLLGDLPGVFTVVSPAFDITIRSELGISLLTTTATDGAGDALPISGDKVSLSTTDDALVVTLPAAVAPSGTLGSFEDTVSGIAYDGSRLTIPIRDPLYREVARLISNPTATSQGSSVRLTTSAVEFVIPQVELLFPPSSSTLESISFGMHANMTELRLNSPLRLEFGLRPTSETLALIELAARERGMSIRQTLALAIPQVPGKITDGSQEAKVVFQVPTSWLATRSSGVLHVAHLRNNGRLDLIPVAELVSENGRTHLEAEIMDAHGTFVLVDLIQSDVPSSSLKIVASLPIATVGVPLEVRVVSDIPPGSDAADSLNSNAVLQLDGQPLGVEPFRAAGDVGVAVFFVPVATPGRHDLTTDGARLQFQAGVRDVFGHAQVFQLRVTPEEVGPGQVVEVMATVANVGPRLLIPETILLVNGAPVQEQPLVISPGGIVDISYELTSGREGIYQVSLLNTQGSFTVSREPTPPSFQVSDLRLEPHTADPGQPISARFTLTNSGESEGVYSLRMFLNSMEAETREILVGGLTTFPVTLTILPQGEGTFAVEVAGMRKEFVIVHPSQRSDLVLETLTLEPPTVAGGDPVVAKVIVRNRTNGPASGVLTILVNNVPFDQREVQIAPAGSAEYRFTLVNDKPGLYQVKVIQGATAEVVTDVLESQYLVTSTLSEASWEIFGMEVTPQPGQLGEPMSVSFQVSNLGQREGELALVVEVNGTRELEETIRLSGLTTRQVSLPLAGRGEGTHNVSVNGTSIQFTVLGAPEPTPAPTQPPAQNQLGRIIATIVVLVVVGGVAGAAWRLRSRRQRG